MPWWGWVIAGLVLLGSELFIPLDFYLIFIGLAGLLTGILVYFGVAEPVWLQWTICAVLSAVLLVTVRKRVVERLHVGGEETGSDLEGHKVKIVSDIAAGTTGKGQVRGTQWNVENATEETLLANQAYVITAVNGLNLVVGQSAD